MKKISIFRAVIFTSIIFLPLITFADTGIGVRDLITGIGATAILIQLFTSTVVKALATLALSVALLAFFYGIIEYIWAKRNGDSGKVKVGGDFIKWSLVALFVMFSVYGIIKLGQSILFQGKDVTTIDLPSFNFNTKGGNPQTSNQGLSSPGDSLQGIAPAPSSNGDGTTRGNYGGFLSKPSDSNPTADVCIDLADGQPCGNGQGVCNQGTCMVDARGASTLGGVGANCTGNGQGTCSAGLKCETVGEGYSKCERPASSSNSDLTSCVSKKIGDPCVVGNNAGSCTDTGGETLQCEVMQ